MPMAAADTRVLPDSGAPIGLRLPGVRLTVVGGPDAGREAVGRAGVVSAGSAKDNDLVLSDDAVSRRHFELRLRPDDVRIVDLGSTNGTTVDGVRIIEAVLTPASLIRAGATAIRVTAVEEPLVIPLSSREKLGALLGRSVAMREAFAVLERVAPSDVTVLIEGETGTGKELAAEAVHTHSARAEGPFVAVDCGAIAPTLMESELFGHVRGAFTGAIGDRKGVFEEADGGTIFLDEIGELPLDLQPKLLRVLERREVRRVGASQSRRVDVRIIAATNRDLTAEMNRGDFREDLYFRLAVVRVRLPPLRTRREDIPLLVQHFVDRIAPGSKPLSPDLLHALATQPWPGNVRELRNAVERAVAMAGPAAPKSAAGVPIVQTPGMESFFTLSYKDALERWSERFERAYLEYALKVSGGSVTGAARLFGVNRRFVQRLMKRLGIREEEPSLPDGDG